MNVLVVFYSRSGVTRKAADAIRGALEAGGATVTAEEIVDRTKRGFLRAGFAAAFKKQSDIEPVRAAVASFDLVLIGTPVWANTMTPAVRTFCNGHGGDAKAVGFFCTMGGSGDRRTFAAMSDLCGSAPVATVALIDKAVKSDGEAECRAKVKAFADAVLAGQ